MSMTQRWLLRAGLAAAVGLGVLAGLARAQSPTQYVWPPDFNPEPVNVIENGMPKPLVPRAAQGPTGFEQYPGEGLAPRPTDHGGPVRNHLASTRQAWRDFYRNHPWYCWAYLNPHLCSSWESERAFIFGSCREFFGEPCMKGPPQVPIPPGYKIPPGYGPPPGFGPPPGYPPGTAKDCSRCP
jgi:hypothetical protein